MCSQKVVHILILVSTAFIYISKGFNSVLWWVSIQLALLNSTGHHSAPHRPFLTFRVVWMASYVIPNKFIWLMGCSSERWEEAVSDICSLGTNLCFWVSLKGRVGAGEISFSASADGLMFNRKPCGCQWRLGFRD